jgi:glycine betaine/proline transport system permease protein
MFGLRSVPHHIIEAAITSGCTRQQILWKVRMPLAFPEIMLGINQTIMFARRFRWV